MTAITAAATAAGAALVAQRAVAVDLVLAYGVPTAIRFADKRTGHRSRILRGLRRGYGAAGIYASRLGGRGLAVALAVGSVVGLASEAVVAVVAKTSPKVKARIEAGKAAVAQRREARAEAKVVREAEKAAEKAAKAEDASEPNRVSQAAHKTADTVKGAAGTATTAVKGTVKAVSQTAATKTRRIRAGVAKAARALLKAAGWFDRHLLDIAMFTRYSSNRAELALPANQAVETSMLDSALTTSVITTTVTGLPFPGLPIAGAYSEYAYRTGTLMSMPLLGTAPKVIAGTGSLYMLGRAVRNIKRHLSTAQPPAAPAPAPVVSSEEDEAVKAVIASLETMMAGVTEALATNQAMFTQLESELAEIRDEFIAPVPTEEELALAARPVAEQLDEIESDLDEIESDLEVVEASTPEVDSEVPQVEVLSWGTVKDLTQVRELFLENQDAKRRAEWAQYRAKHGAMAALDAWIEQFTKVNSNSMQKRISRSIADEIGIGWAPGKAQRSGDPRISGPELHPGGSVPAPEQLPDLRSSEAGRAFLSVQGVEA